MYIVVIAWMYVVLMMSITESSIVAGVMTFLFYGLLPCALMVWLFGGASRLSARRREQTQARPLPDSVTHQHVDERNRADANSNQNKLEC